MQPGPRIRDLGKHARASYSPSLLLWANACRGTLEKVCGSPNNGFWIVFGMLLVSYFKILVSATQLAKIPQNSSQKLLPLLLSPRSGGLCSGRRALLDVNQFTPMLLLAQRALRRRCASGAGRTCLHLTLQLPSCSKDGPSACRSVWWRATGRFHVLCTLLWLLLRHSILPTNYCQ